MARLTWEETAEKIENPQRPEKQKTKYWQQETGDSGVKNMMWPYMTRDEVPQYEVFKIEQTVTNDGKMYTNEFFVSVEDDKSHKLLVDNGYWPVIKFFMDLPVIQPDGTVVREVFERGKTFKNNILDLFDDYGDVLDSTVFKVTKRGSGTEIDYKIKPNSEIKFISRDMWPPEQSISKLATKTYDEVKVFIETGSFPQNK